MTHSWTPRARARARRVSGRTRRVPAPYSGTHGNRPGVLVITSHRGSYTLDVSRVAAAWQARCVTDAAGYDWPAGVTVEVGRQGQWRAYWAPTGMRWSAWFPGVVCQMITRAAH